MNQASQAPSGDMSSALREKFDKLVKPKWIREEVLSPLSVQEREELWNDTLGDFWKPIEGKYGVYGYRLIQRFPDFVNALSLSEALEVQRLLKSWVDAVRDKTLEDINQALRLPKNSSNIG